MTWLKGYHSLSGAQIHDWLKEKFLKMKEGYVYSKDLNLELHTLDEVIDYINLGQFEYTIPIYAVDGIEKIDTFEVSTEN